MLDLVNIVIPPLTESYSYLVPPSLKAQLTVGAQVTVSFGRRIADGFIVGVEQSDKSLKDFPFALKPIDLEEKPVPSFHAQQLSFFRWVADYYGEPLASVLDLAVPRVTELRRAYTIKVKPGANTAQIRGAREREILELLLGERPPSYQELAQRFPSARAILRKLEEKGLITTTAEDIMDLAFAQEAVPEWAKRSVALDATQQAAVLEINQAITSKVFSPFLLHGVTGSGKTEVYIESIKHCLATGRSVIVVVPEIALTPQLLDRFRARLGPELAVLHSALAARQRWTSWQALLQGRAHVAIGARSAIFAPLRDVGLIIVDEEHDGSYKQSDGIRYHGRDVAVALAHHHHCPVVLGSATPSLESLSNVEQHKYKLLSLPGRHESGSQVAIELVDLNQLRPWEMATKLISPILKEALSDTLARGEQAFLLYNRRGFSNYLQCPKCEEPIRCENCSVTMTLHRATNQLLCHYCNLSIGIPRYCPRCPGGATELEERGAGTERLFDEVKELFPNAIVARLDRDSAGDHETYRSMLEQLRAGTIQVVVGTQMLAKGHDLPNVTLVGVADCDVGLHLPDFRAAERVFHLLTQAAGRAGRGDKPGRVILQTRTPQHASLVKTAARDFAGFAELELRNRKELGYPPYTRMVRIVASSQDKSLPLPVLMGFRSLLVARKEQELSGITILGPAPAPLERLRTMWRYHLLVKSARPSDINRVLKLLQAHAPTNDKIRMVYDVDPQEML